jgi:hypothetical protein
VADHVRRYGWGVRQRNADADRGEPEFGYRFLLDETREAGGPIAERTAWRICSQLGWRW